MPSHAVTAASIGASACCTSCCAGGHLGNSDVWAKASGGRTDPKTLKAQDGKGGLVVDLAP